MTGFWGGMEGYFDRMLQSSVAVLPNDSGESYRIPLAMSLTPYSGWDAFNTSALVTTMTLTAAVLQ